MTLQDIIDAIGLSKKITELPNADALTGGDLGETVQGGTNKKFTFSQVSTFLSNVFQLLSQKNQSGGYVGLSGFKIIIKNFASGLFTSFIQQNNTANRTYTLQDRDGTLADLMDISDLQTLILGSNGFRGLPYAIWDSLPGFNFDCYTPIYFIGGVEFPSMFGSVTLGTADPSNPRLDVIGVDNTGNFFVAPGTPAVNPVKPTVDSLTQLEITTVLVAAGATSPTQVNEENIYLENTEWVGSSNLSGVDFDSVASPYAGSKSVYVPGWTNIGKYIKFTKATIFNSANSFYLLMRIKLISALPLSGPNTGGFIISFRNGATTVSTSFTVTHGVYGFSSTDLAGYQLLAIPLSEFTFTGSYIDGLNVILKGTSASGMYMDNVLLQGGIPSINSLQNALTTIQADSGAAVSNQANDVFQFLGLEGTFISASGKIVNIKALPLIIASGTDTYTGTVPTTLATNHVFRVKIPNNNTGASTFNTVPIKKNVTEALAANDLKANGVYIFHYDGTNYQVIGLGGGGGGSGDVVGPASATNNALVLYDGTTGKLIKDSAKILSTVGGNIAALTNPSAITFLRLNADNTVTARTESQFLDDIYAGYTSDSTPLDTDEIFSRDTVSNLNLRTTLLNLWTNYLKAKADALYVGLTGDQTIAGVKTFSSFPVTPSSAPTSDYQVANKKYVDDNISDELELAYTNSIYLMTR